MADFQRQSNKFLYDGVNLRRPVDLQPDRKCPFMSNVDPTTIEGVAQARSAIDLVSKVSNGNGPVHSLRRLNDAIPTATQPYARFVGVGSELFSGQQAGSFNPLVAPNTSTPDSGYSGNPLSLVPYRPPQSPESWMYVYDSLQQRKYKTDGTAQNVGGTQPSTSPVTDIYSPAYLPILDPASASGWSATGSAGAVSYSAARVTASTTLSYILYDTGTSGMACFGVNNSGNTYQWMTSGSRLTLSGTETVTVEQAFTGSYSTTIAAVQYDAGSTGLATIQPVAIIPGLQRNMLLVLNSNSTPVRVLSVTAGPDGKYSFRASVPFTVAATETIAGVPSFRAWVTMTHAANDTVTSGLLATTVTLPAGQSTATGQVSLAINLNLTVLANGSPLLNEDYMHVGLLFDHPEYVSEVHVMLDVDSSNNNFSQNYYYYVTRQGDFQQSQLGDQTTIASSLTAIQNAIATSFPAAGLTSAQIPYPGQQVPIFSTPDTEQLDTGQNAWYDLMFKINDLTRVGTDTSRTLANVKAIGILVLTENGSPTMQFAGWWAGGGSGPDCNFNSYGNQGIPIQYRYRYRSSTTGAMTAQSPATRIGELPRRQTVSVTFPAPPDAQFDLADIERFGGTNPDWHRVAFLSSAAGVYYDTVTESAAGAGDPLELGQYQPWPVTDLPHTGTVNTIGTSIIWVSGSKFNLNWVRGTYIEINNQTYTVRAVNSTTFLETEENVGVYSAAAFVIPEATIASQPLPFCWGPFDDRVFGVGDPFNPGRLYFSNQFNPDSASDSGYIEVTSPSEPLLNGFSNEAGCYVFSAQSLFRVEPTNGGANPYAYQRLGGCKGLASPWAFSAHNTANSPILLYLATDGVYRYAWGAESTNATDDDLYPIFPHFGVPGLPYSILGFVLWPVGYSKQTVLRITYADAKIHLNYQDSQDSNGDGVQQTLRYSVLSKGWVPFHYSPGAVIHYQEEGVENPVTLVGCTDGNLYQISQIGSVLDAGANVIGVNLVTPALDQGDSRVLKQYGDLMVDYIYGQNSAGLVGVEPLFNNLLNGSIASSLPATPTLARNQQVVPVGLNNEDDDSQYFIARNIGLSLSWSADYRLQLFEWQPSYIITQELSTTRLTSWQDAGSLGYKFVHGVRLHCDTNGAAKSLTVQYDGQIIGPTFYVNTVGEQIVVISFPTPFKAHLMRLRPNDTMPWRYWGCEWVVNPEPEPTTDWIIQPTSFDMAGYLHCREIWASYAGQGVITIVVDGVAYSLPAVNSSQAVKTYLPTPPIKGRLWGMSATGTNLQVYEKDCEFKIKSWASNEPYRSVRPIGEVTRTNGGARI